MIQSENQELADHLIEKYRDLIKHRYDFESLQHKIKIPPTITREVEDEVKGYFLECIYPPSEDRHELELAFSNLDTYLSRPAKMLNLVGSMTSAIFKFGRHFPKAVKAGMTSLQSFRDAKNFELILLKAAISRDLSIPISTADFEQCMKDIPKYKSKKLVKDIRSLLHSMSDTELSGRTIEILNGAIDKMKGQPRLYEEFEIHGVQLGASILQRGHDLFKNLDRRTRKDVVGFIVTAENHFLDELHQ